ncbi:MAG TPA: prepilin-type N-terminal cleavage/methylation domain-containing protein [Phycisphaerae bacterium]|nr:prepilin-type N-terminal cleavage/methylation domain-containing protein [Phycisphaerae bacterium]
MKVSPIQLRRRGFSLIEVLLATFILAIGLIMVATIFPVGADWTRQATEDTVSRTIAENAFNLIRSRVTGAQMTSVSTTLQGLPGLTAISLAERTYQFGNTNPYPAPNPPSSNYYWTALTRVSPAQMNTISKTYDVYILVFRKGDASQTFYNTGYSPPAGFTDMGTSATPVRDSDESRFPTTPLYANFKHYYEPTLVIGQYNSGTYDSTLDPPVKGAYPPIGFYGIGATSGTVFRQITAVDVNTASNTKATARPNVSPGENIIYAPPADGTSASPLVYVYQTTLTF